MRRTSSTFLLLAFAVLVSPAFGASPTERKDKYEWQAGKWVKAAEPAEGTPAGELELVRYHLETGNCAKAVKAAKKFKKHYPFDEHYEEVCLLAGKAEMARNRHFQAYEWFEKQLDQFPAGKHSDEAIKLEYEVAEAFLGVQKRVTLGFMKLNATDEALEILMRIAEHAPGTELAAKSLLRIADHHYQTSKWPESVNAYDRFLELFPRSAKSGYAAGQAAQATWASFEGVRFDETPLLEAEQRFKSFIESYPAEARKIRARQILGQIAAARAQKLFEAARLYERIGKPSSAAFYYKQIVTSYPGTQWAKDASLAVAIFSDSHTDRPAPVVKRPGGTRAGRPARPDLPDRARPAPEDGDSALPVKGGEQK